jgi:enoyl-CoA hydratase/carnithine racemase
MADRLAEPVDVRLASAGVALVTLNLPRLRNAMTTELTAAWTAAMDEVTTDRSLRAVVVTGAGRAFCSGADLSWLDQDDLGDNTPDRLRDKMLPFYRTWLAPRQIPVPVVAREMLYTGRVLAAREALSWGLVSEVAEDVVGRALEVAEGVARSAPIPVRLTKAGLAQRSPDGFEAALQWEALAQPVTMATADLHRGIQARREHRSPTFEGS